VLASLVVLAIFLQVYFIASSTFGAPDALDAHETFGNIIHLVEALVFLTAIGAYWKRWGEIGLNLALPVIGTIQVSLTDADEWVGGLHGLLALVVFVLAAVIAHRAMRALGLRERRAV